MSNNLTCVHIAILGVVLGLVSTLRASAEHPFHASTAVIEFNAETDSLEVALCVFPDDFAETLSESGLGPLNYEDGAEVDRRALAYVQSHFQLKLRGRPLDPHWVGHEHGTQQLWLYFEFPVDPAQLEHLTVEQRMLMEQFDDQVNDVTFHVGESTRTLTFTAESAGPQRFVARD